MPDQPFGVQVALLHTTTARHPRGTGMLLFSRGTGQTLDLGEWRRPQVHSVLCAAQAGPRQAAELGLPLAVAAPKAGAGWEHTTEEHTTGNAQFCEREKADLQTLKVPVSENEKPIPSSFSSAKRQVFGEAEMIQQGTNKGTWEGVLAEGGC